MIASAHVADGALAGVIGGRASSAGVVPSTTIAMLLGLASHMLMDAIPPSEYKFMSPSRHESPRQSASGQGGSNAVLSRVP